MSKEEMRKEFDEWFEANVVIGFRCEEVAAWSAWQASRESLVIELPSEDDSRCDTVAEIAKQEAYNLALGECASAIEAAGLKVKS